MMNELYKEYLSERQGQSIIERPDGFLIYKIMDGECFLRDIFVSEKKRRTGITNDMLGELVTTARENQCKFITANIYTLDVNANSTLRAALACGFEIKSCGNNVFLIAKDIGGL